MLGIMDAMPDVKLTPAQRRGLISVWDGHTEIVPLLLVDKGLVVATPAGVALTDLGREVIANG